MFKVVVTFMSVSAVLVLKSGKFCMQLHLDKRNNCSLLTKEGTLLLLAQRGNTYTSWPKGYSWFLTKEPTSWFLTKEPTSWFLTKEPTSWFLTKEPTSWFLTKEPTSHVWGEGWLQAYSQAPCGHWLAAGNPEETWKFAEEFWALFSNFCQPSSRPQGSDPLFGFLGRFGEAQPNSWDSSRPPKTSPPQDAGWQPRAEWF